ncbi:hypothetical protein [Corynebacterium xerosis]|uniref:hypothetical protein n=1 Tax=Corynebacterium xerosis TaxID=1725 RepID=UPI00366D2FDE
MPGVTCPSSFQRHPTWRGVPLSLYDGPAPTPFDEIAVVVSFRDLVVVGGVVKQTVARLVHM